MRSSPSTPDRLFADRLTTRTIIVGAVLAAVLAAQPVPAQTANPDPGPRPDVVGDRLADIERALQESRRKDDRLREQADVLAREIAGLRAEMIRAARTTQEHENNLAMLQARLAELDEEEKAKSRALVSRRQKLAELLGALERLARLPPEAMLALPASPHDTVRSAILLRAAVPELHAQAQALREDIEALALVREDITAKRTDLQAQAEALNAERQRLAGLIARKASLEKETAAEREKAALKAKSLASEAGDLRELLARLEDERKAREAAAHKAREAAERQARELAKRQAAEETARAAAAQERQRRDQQAQRERTEAAARAPRTAPPAQEGAQPSRMASLPALRPGSFSKAKGRLAFPAQGRLVQSYGERLAAGGEARGITLETQPGAQIVAPYDGQVVFAGAFRDYGQLLIIEHGEGYHMLLAGFDRIDSAVSQTLLAGEPVGVMARPAEGNPRLYIELRHNGRPINPLPWLATPIGKVSG